MPYFPNRPEPGVSSSPLDTSLTSSTRDPTSNVDRRTDQEARIQVKNRRKRYLDLHPEYFRSLDLELADPLLYNRLVRRFQTAEERESEQEERGLAGVMEANFTRDEAKAAALQNPDPESPVIYREAEDGSIVETHLEEITREEAWEEWVDEMSQRFMSGGDRDFDYRPVDGGEEYDDHAEEDREALEKYLDEEEEEPVRGGGPGETGIQDY